MNIINLSKKFFSKKSNTIHHSKKIIQSSRDWKIILVSLGVLALGLIFFSLYLLNHIKQENAFKVEGGDKKGAILINQKLLDSTLSSFEQKKNKEALLKDNLISITDPSL